MKWILWKLGQCADADPELVYDVLASLGLLNKVKVLEYGFFECI